MRARDPRGWRPLLMRALAQVWECTAAGLAGGGAPQAGTDAATALAEAKALVDSLQVVREVAPMLTGKAQRQLATLLPAICTAASHPHAAVRLCPLQLPNSAPLAHCHTPLGAFLSQVAGIVELLHATAGAHDGSQVPG